MTIPEEGTIVQHTSKADWGLGKVVAVEGHNVHVFFLGRPGRDAVRIREDGSGKRLERAGQQSHPRLDSIPPFQKDGGVYSLSSARLTFDESLRLFLRRFPGGFEDEGYLGDRQDGERHYKWWAHETFERLFGNGQGLALLEVGDIPELTRRLLEVDKSNNLLHPNWDKAPLKDGLADDEAAATYFRALFAYLEAPAPDPERFEAYAEAIGRLPQPGSPVLSWPVTTVFPYLANPERDMFLRPTEGKQAAELMAFELNYGPRPNWRTYRCLLTLARVMLDELRPHGARDLIDVQSFLWVIRYEAGR